MEINGVAHVILTVRSMERSKAFYCALMEHMGLTRVVDLDDYLYYVGGRTAVGLRPAAGEHADEPFDQGRTGLQLERLNSSTTSYASLSRSSLPASFGSALPPLARITWPTSAPSRFGLPAL